MTALYRLLPTAEEQAEIDTYTEALKPKLEAVARHLADAVDILFLADAVVNQGELENWMADDVTLPLLTMVANILKARGRYSD